ncbi:hypothetical protein CU669_06445 [Paramagnetospirillum kuznetsovii]|uniref:Histidine kinase/HSP90-like ATPase domain-containing protein n=1 Tax=Paramagnetospirillum kuznetsovii TaxID=2053833 RepID=A0A364P0Y4_9PROT|nr:ATP-binding protein [Paramagnetospirillum kuznetsovii]RAU23009.1 hypothetical protein CU669_06445 [Paramagnetospirillum kuznetsovii]
MSNAAPMSMTNAEVDAVVAARLDDAMRDANGGAARPLAFSAFDSGKVEDLAQFLEAAVGVWIDVACKGHAAFQIPPDADLVLRVSTAAAIRLDVADAVARAMMKRFQHLQPLESDIRCALQEAIGNAVIHGNLGLDGSLRATMEGLRIFSATMEQRQSDPALACLPITIRAKAHHDGVTFVVEDMGAGFTPPTIGPEPIPAVAAGGLGLAIIHRCCAQLRFDSGGRCIDMAFRL